MSVNINWIQAVAGLVIGFLLKVLFDELKYARLRILRVSRTPFVISPEIKVIANGIDNYYSAYRIRVENKQKRYLNCAAENCIAWLELDSAPEPYQICWVGSCPDVTINVGDVREVDFCARGNTTGKIYAPTERGYFESSPREIGDGKSELRGKLRITSKNGKREEKRFVIKPANNQLEICILDKNESKTISDSVKTKDQSKSKRRLLMIMSVIIVLLLLATLGTLFNKALELLSTSHITNQLFWKYVFQSLAGTIALLTTYFISQKRNVKLIITLAIYLYILGLVAELYSY
jgi:hypothetical protein